MKGMKPVPFDARTYSAYLAEAGRAIVQPKLNGIHLYWSGSELYYLSGEPCRSLPHVQEALKELFPSVPVEGEAYAHGLTLEEIQGIVCRDTPAENAEEIGIHIFDLALPSIPQWARLMSLDYVSLDDGPDHVAIVPHVKAPDRIGLNNLLEGYLEQGYEGVVVRHPDATWRPGRRRCLMKLKPGGRDTYPILRVRGVAGQVETLMLARPDDEGESFCVPVRGELRRRLWPVRRLLPGRRARVEYSHLTGRGVPSGARITGIEGGIPVPEREVRS